MRCDVHCNNFPLPEIISPANKSTTQDAILPWHSTSTRWHLIFSATHALVLAGVGGGSSVLLITVQLDSAAWWDREAVLDGRSLHKFGVCLGEQTENLTSLHSKRNRDFKKYWAQCSICKIVTKTITRKRSPFEKQKTCQNGENKKVCIMTDQMWSGN